MAELRATEVGITSNARVKLYPSCTVLQVSNAPMFRAPGWEPELRAYDVPSKGKAKNKARSLESSRNRAKAAMRDICLCNRFTHFFTWTFSPEKVDRYDADIIKRKTLDTLKNLVQRKNFAYVCVPEPHEDGALHLHGLCKIGDMRLVRATHAHTGKPLSTDYGQPIFNMPDWSFGHSTCVPIDDNYERVVSYVLKYIGKGSDKIFGKWYYSSRNLTKRPEIQLLDPLSYDAFIDEYPDAAIVPIFHDIRMGIKQFPV